MATSNQNWSHLYPESPILAWRFTKRPVGRPDECWLLRVFGNCCCDNHAHAVNENWGRELLELFSLGVGNYTETDVREASRAFTGWTIAYTPPRGYYNRWDWEFQYLEEDHVRGEQMVLGHTGNFNGADIIDIIVQQPACHQFIARHLYNFFVADDVQVPAWMTTPPRDPEAVDTIAGAFKDSQYDMRSTLRVLFNSDFFKNARFAKITSPAEVVVV